MNISKNQKGILLAFTGATLWGLSGVMGEYLLNVSKLDSIWVIINRLFFAGLLMILFLIIRDKDKVFLIFSQPKDVLLLINFSFTGLAVCQGTYFLAIKYTNAGTATVLQYVGPVMIMAYYCIKQFRLPTMKEITSIVMSLIGVFIIVTHFNLANIVISKEGLFWGLMSALGLATYNIFSINLIAKYGTMTIMGWAMVISGSIGQCLTGNFYVPDKFNYIDLLAFIIVIVLGTIMSFTLYLQGMQLIGPVKSSIIACFEPVAAIMFSLILLGTTFNIFDVFGATLILGAVLVLNRR